jgi:hypothetical protein
VPPVMPPLANIALLDPDGHPTTLQTCPSPLLVVQLVRYFGCLPCQQWLLELDGSADRLARSGAQPVAVGGSADYQARWLRDEKGVRMSLFLDPGQDLRDALQIGTLGVRLLNPRGLGSYARALRQGLRPQAITKDTVQAPGVVILNQERTVIWQHVGKRIGDYPSVRSVIEAVDNAVAKQRRP